MLEGAKEPSKATGVACDCRWVGALKNSSTVLDLVVRAPNAHLLDKTQRVNGIRLVLFNSPAARGCHAKPGRLRSKRVAVRDEPILEHTVLNNDPDAGIGRAGKRHLKLSRETGRTPALTFMVEQHYNPVSSATL